MMIKIGENWAITSDKRNIILNEIGVKGEDSKNPGEEYLQPVGFFGDLKHCLCDLLERKIKKADAENISSLIGVIKSTKKEIIEAVNDND